ncbi:MAG: hypothetical protein H7095_00760 [Pseudopedobacter sp.]|nr:hypothetical protein [Deinococcales bacterium]
MADIFETTLPLTAPTTERLEQMKALILEALEDDQLTRTEMKGLRDARVKLGLSVEEVRSLRREIYSQALERCNADNVLSKDEVELLNRIMLYFNAQP